MSAEPSSSAETVTQVRVANLCCALEADLSPKYKATGSLSGPHRPRRCLRGKRSERHAPQSRTASRAHCVASGSYRMGCSGASHYRLLSLLFALPQLRSGVDDEEILGRFGSHVSGCCRSGHRNAMDRAVLVGAIVNLSGLLQSCMGIRVTASLAGIMATTETPTATLADSRKLVQVEDLEVGDRILVRTGDSIPADGKVIDGSASVDESRLTGESIPVYKSKGSEVYSGTLVVKGALPCVEVTSRVGRTQKVTDLIQEATAQRTPLQDTVDTFAKYYTPLVVIIFLAIGIYCWSLERGLIVLVAACPCSIVMAAPVAYMTAIVTGVRQYYGTVLKSPTVIEVLAKIQLVAFDKTGTLTQGEHHVTSVRRFPASGTLQERDILRLAAGVESLSPHPLASSVVNYYTGCAASYVESPSTLPAVENFRTVGDNLGVAGTVEGKEVMIGGPAMLRYLGLGLEKITEGSASVLFVVIDGKVALSLELEDRIRPGAQEALKSLKKPTMMLTGDRPSVARDVAAEIGIDDYKADLRPGDKLDFIRDYQASDPKTLPLTHARMGSSIQHPVMMVGDGLNDGPALALAAVGVSFASPCRAVSEKAADIVITDPNRGLFLLSHLIVLGSRVRNIIRENLALALCTKAIVVAVGAAGYIPLWASVLSDGLCLLLVMVNGARPLDWKPSNAAVMDKFVNEATQVRSSAVPVPVKEPSSTKCKSSCCQKGAGNTCCGSKSDKACGGASESLPNRGLAPPTNEVRSCRASKCCSVPNVEGRQQQASKCCDDAQEAAAVGSASCRSKQCCKAGPN